MWRLGLDKLLPENDREQLIQLTHSVSAGEDVEALIKAIQDSTDTKPLLVALAGIFREVAVGRMPGIPRREDTDSLVMVGAMMGAYVGFLSRLSDRNDAHLRDAVSALLSISAAFGGAIAVSAILRIQEIQAQRSRST